MNQDHPKPLILPGLQTPLQALESLSRQTGVRILMKRDDLNPFGMGGNKIRKLAYLLQDAIERGADTVLTVGGVQTNHGRLTAALASTLGLDCVLLLNGNEPDETNGNLLLDRLFGARIVFEPDPDALEERKRRLLAELKHQGKTVYDIPLGGSSPLGVLGYAEAAGEIQKDLSRMDEDIDRILCAYGSGGTYAGLLLGCARLGLPWKVTGLNVLRPAREREALRFELNALLAETAERYRLDVDPAALICDIVMESVHDGYNRPHPAVNRTIRRVAREEGILLDPCYTGKAFHTLLTMIEDGRIARGRRVLFLHTGGLPALFAPHNRKALLEQV